MHSLWKDLQQLHREGEMWASLCTINRLLPDMEGKSFQAKETKWTKHSILTILGILGNTLYRHDGCWKSCVKPPKMGDFHAKEFLSHTVENWVIVLKLFIITMIKYFLSSGRLVQKVSRKINSQEWESEGTGQPNIDHPVLHQPPLVIPQSLAANWAHKIRWKVQGFSLKYIIRFISLFSFSFLGCTHGIWRFPG